MQRNLSKLLFLYLTLILLIASKLNAHGQSNVTHEITGIALLGMNNTPVIGATVSLQTSDGKIILSTFTEEDGSFQIQSGFKDKFSLHISYVGIETYISDSMELSSNLDLGTIFLNKVSQELEGVVVVARKNLIENKGDRIAYNASADISNKSGTATDVLRKAPMLTVDPDGAVKMRGNSNIKVLINGMPSAILAKNLKEALKMIPASSIQSIEVITNPSAKYEAEGAAGVINIITKKKLSGTSGSLDLSAGNLEQSGNLSLNMAKGKFNFSLMANASHEKNRNTSQLNRESIFNNAVIGTLQQRRDATQRDKGGYGGFTIAYQIDSLQKIEVGGSYWRGQWPEKSSFYNLYKGSSGEEEYNQASRQDGKYDYYDANLNYQKKFRRKGQEFQFIGQTSFSADKSYYVTDQYLVNGIHVFREESPNVGNNRDWSLQTDYVHPISKGGKSNIEIGARYMTDKSKSNYRVINTLNNVDPSRSDIMEYTQSIFSGYLSMSIQTDNGWRFRPGIRFESTDLKASFEKTPSFSSSYSNWVPSMLIIKKLNDQHELKINYAERIRRPWIWNLNPYVDASDPTNLRAGNPNLRPELTKMFELGHAYNASSGLVLNSSIYYNLNNNAVESITTVDGSGRAMTTSKNIGSNQRLGTNVNASFSIDNDWTFNAAGELFYLKFKSEELRQKSDGTFFNLNLNSSYKMSDYSFLLSGDYGNGYITLQGKRSQNYSYRMAVRRELLKNKASITLSLNNPFQKNFVQRSWASAATFSSSSENRFYNRSVSVAFSWQFGSLNMNEKSESSFSEKEFDGKTRNK